jgi:hypothetical protein
VPFDTKFKCKSDEWDAIDIPLRIETICLHISEKHIHKLNCETPCARNRTRNRAWNRTCRRPVSIFMRDGYFWRQRPKRDLSIRTFINIWLHGCNLDSLEKTVLPANLTDNSDSLFTSNASLFCHYDNDRSTSNIDTLRRVQGRDKVSYVPRVEWGKIHFPRAGEIIYITWSIGGKIYKLRLCRWIPLKTYLCLSDQNKKLWGCSGWPN